MAAFHPQVENLPGEIPVFPLEGALLIPRGKLPLNIFEPRYLAMTEDAFGAGRIFGMIQPDPSAAPAPNGPALYRIGCLGRLSSFAETEDNRYLITLIGVARFRVDREVEMRRGYRRVRADYTEFLGDLDLEPHPIGIGREVLVSSLRGYFQRRGFDANWEAIRRISDDMLVTTLAMICPFEPAEKQALLEAPAEPDRAQTLLALLQIGAAAENLAGHRVS